MDVVPLPATHEVANQPGPRGAADPWAEDAALRALVPAMGGDPAPVAALGARIAGDDAWELGREARRHPPEARLFDVAGRRLDEVRFHPTYHAPMRMGLEAGHASHAWGAARRAGTSPTPRPSTS